jgi:hypothetical protein
VHGKVTLNGEPAPVVLILFKPDSSKGNSGPGVKVTGHQGFYETSPDKGVTQGPQLVEITAFDGISTEDSKKGNALTKVPYETSVIIPDHDSEQNFDLPDSHLAKQ